MKPSSACRLALMMLLPAWGCNPSQPPNPGGGIIAAADVNRDTAAARRHNDEALGLLQRGDLPAAEKEIKAAIKADPLFGPAHNTLGMWHFRQKSNYEAAMAFQDAAHFMPKQAEPRNNLGLVLEAAGKLEDASKAFDEALALEPSSAEVTGNLARVCVRLNRRDERTRRLLQDIVMKDSRPEWVAWAGERLALMTPTTLPATAPAATE